MNDHLPGICETRLQTARLESRILTSGPDAGEPVLLLHGNLSSSTFWEETMLALPKRFCTLAPDQRGYGLSDPQRCIDATRGVADWADDAVSLADHLGWDRFHLVGHSLGGCVAWAVLGLQPQRLASVTFIAPGPPCGFGGARGVKGELNHEDGAGAGAGLVHPEFVARLCRGERDAANPLFSPRAVMQRVYWKPPFCPAREEQFLTAMLQVHCGQRQFPGDTIPSPHWPGFAPGKCGPINAISSKHNQRWQELLLNLRSRPPILWITGKDDLVISDHALSDAGAQGKLGVRPDWPGEGVFPPQPLYSQVRYAMDQYEQRGGIVRRLVLSDVGHSPHLERPAEVHSAIARHLSG